MPGLNGTGPMGQGSKTGRGMGRCSSNNDSENNVGFGRRMGRGRGMGRGFKKGFNVIPEDVNSSRIEELEKEVEILKDQLKDN